MECNNLSHMTTTVYIFIYITFTLVVITMIQHDTAIYKK